MEAGLALIGKGIEYLPYLIYVFTEIGKGGIGTGLYPRGNKRRGGRFELGARLVLHINMQIYQ